MQPPPSLPVNSTRPGDVVHSPRGRTYFLGECLGSGRFGATYDATGPFDQPYAIKVLTPANRPHQAVRYHRLLR